MRRLLVLFLLALLPLTASFAAADHCRYEDMQQHHSPQCDVRVPDHSAADVGTHADCCHFSCSIGIAAAGFPPFMPQLSRVGSVNGDDRFTSVALDTPERPPAAPQAFFL